MKSTKNTRKAVDLTPPAVSNWISQAPSSPAVLVVNPEASLHQRVALTWSLAYDLMGLAGLARAARDTDEQVDCLPVIEERLTQLVALLEDLGSRTAEMEGGAS